MRAISLLSIESFHFFQKFDFSHKDNSKPIIILGFSESRSKNESLTVIFQRKIQAKVQSLPIQTTLALESDKAISFIKSLKDDLAVNHSLAFDYGQLWTITRKWIRARQTIPSRAPELGSVLYGMQTAKILKSDVSRKGTQLKLLITLEGGQKQYALFKPRRYSRDYLTDDIVSGADRHNGEIFGAFSD